MQEETLSKLANMVASEDFDRLQFLKAAAQLAPRSEAKIGLLSLYAIYHYLHRQDNKKSLECIDQCLNLKPDDTTISILLTTKAAVLTCIDKPTEALHLLKQSTQISSIAYFAEDSSPLRKPFSSLIAALLLSLKITRGKRQFLVFLEGVRVKSGSLNGLDDIQRAAALKVSEIRESMRGGSKQGEQRLEGSDMVSSRRQNSPPTSIYISRLYEQRKMALGKRDNSSSKKQAIDPFTWRKERQQSRGDCDYM